MIHTRLCHSDDFAEVVALLHQLWPDKVLDPRDLRTVFDGVLASAQQVFLCAAEEDRVVGFGSLTIRNSLWQEGLLGHIDELVVDGQCRGRGIGTALLQHLLAMAKDRGCLRVELDTAFHRKDAHRFYEKQGFENRAYLFSKAL